MGTSARTPTQARETFSANLDRLTSLLAVFGDEWDVVNDSMRAILGRLRGKLEAVERGEVIVDSQEEEAEEAAVKSRAYRTNLAHDFFSEWHAVMLVTFTEAYLEDALAACAAVDQRLMARSEQAVNYEDVRLFDSVEALLGLIRHRWARNFVDDGGPRRWIERLERMGARGYSAADTTTLEELWGIRHVVVHSAGRVTRDFVRRHPGLGQVAGSPLRLDATTFPKPYAEAVLRFVDTSDEFFAARYGGPEAEILTTTRL